MQFDINSNVVKLCAKGMELEAVNAGQAKDLFMQAWHTATTDIEKFTAAHYVARRQPTTQNKLHWDETALQFALKIKDGSVTAAYPSLYLNIAKCYEELNDMTNACINYKAAQQYAYALSADEYGKLISNGVQNGLARVCT